MLSNIQLYHFSNGQSRILKALKAFDIYFQFRLLLAAPNNTSVA